MKEIIICAAVRRGDDIWRGHRHPHAIAAMNDQLSYTMPRKEITESKVRIEQGFITSENRYVDREEALRIQKEAGIESINKDGYGGCLFSEDLY